MAGPVFSSLWYRVAALTPRLRSNARIHRHQYRGETWYVLHDVASGRIHRFSPGGYLIIGLMDGTRSVQDLWDLAANRLGDDAPTQDEMIQLLAQLQGADVLQCDIPPDTGEILGRYADRQRTELWRRWISPLSWRFSLVDPERVLRALAPVVLPAFSIGGALLWLAVVGTALFLAAVHWTDLTTNFVDRLLMPQNAAVLWLVFPVVKLVHEFGHAFAVKAFGGEVHDMGVMMLVVTPVPYVDASAASAFRSKWHRAVVGLAGMGVELFLASFALFTWLSVEPGLLRTLCYNVILVAGVSTVLFNANPLLRYDGYYVAGDLLEIPNLYSRSRAWLAYATERWLLGRRELEPPTTAPGERRWFFVYATTSFAYRAIVALGIVLFLAHFAFYLGLFVALLSVSSWTVVPLVKGLHYVVRSPQLREVRGRATVVVGLIIAVVAVGVVAVPTPYRTRAEGVVWIPETAFVRPGAEGFVARVVAQPARPVKRGDTLIVCDDPALTARATEMQARVRELEARLDSERVGDRVKMQVIEEDLRYARTELARVNERLAALVIHAGVDGTFVLPQAGDLPGRFVKQGELLGYVVDLDRLIVRTVVGQETIDLVRHQVRRVDVRLAERLDEPLPAVVKREVPGASELLPSPALGSEGGGRVAVDPRDPRHTTAIQKVFQVDLEVPSASGFVNVGGRVHVRFDHGRAPLVVQWYRQLRQLFLSRLSV